MAEIRAERVGLHAYVDILRVISCTPRDAHEIEQVTGWTRRPILRFLRALERMELVHVDSWQKPPGNRCYVERFAMGYGVSAQKPHTRGQKGTRAMTQDKKFRAHSLAIGHLLRALSEGATRSELIEQTGISRRTFQTLIPYMMEAPRLIHIVDWKRRQICGGPPEPIFMLGRLKNAPKPNPIGDRVANRKYRAKVASRGSEHGGYSVFSAHTGSALLSLA